MEYLALKLLLNAQWQVGPPCGNLDPVPVCGTTTNLKTTKNISIFNAALFGCLHVFPWTLNINVFF